MSEPLFVPDEFEDGDDQSTPEQIDQEDERRLMGRLADPDDPDSDYVHGQWAETRSGIPSRPLVAHRCDRIRRNGARCKQWSIHGSRYCVAHSGVRNLPNVKEYHEQVVHNAKLALMQVVPRALERIEQIITDDDADIPASVRLRASTEVLDRVGVRGGTEIDVTVESTEDPGATLAARLDVLRSRAVAAAIAAGQPDPRVIEGEVVSDTADQPTLFDGEETP